MGLGPRLQALLIIFYFFKIKIPTQEKILCLIEQSNLIIILNILRRSSIIQSPRKLQNRDNLHQTCRLKLVPFEW